VAEESAGGAPVFTEADEIKKPEGIELVFGPAAMPASPEFLEGVLTFLERMSKRFDLWLLFFPEQGDAPLAPNTFGRTHRSFDEGRWYSEVKARAVLADLTRNAELKKLVFFEDDGMLLATPHAAGFTVKRVITLLDRAPDQGTTRGLLPDIGFLAWSENLEFHLIGADPADVAWVKQQLP
jgi:hypothetical protein